MKIPLFLASLALMALLGVGCGGNNEDSTASENQNLMGSVEDVKVPGEPSLETQPIENGKIPCETVEKLLRESSGSIGGASDELKAAAAECGFTS